MSLANKLADERRARLAAERLLELKQTELFAANRKLGSHARALSNEIVETRAEVANVRDENLRVKSDLTTANQKIEIVETQLWKALESIRDGFAMFNADQVLELANPSWLAHFDGLDTIRPGASFHHVIDMMVEEGIVDLRGESGGSWRRRMNAQWQSETAIAPESVRLWSGQFLNMLNRRMPDGGMVSLAVDVTDLMRMWSAVDEMPDGFVLYDADDRLMMCNERYRTLYAPSAPAMVPGATFEDILRYGLEHGQYEDADGREDDWLEEQMEMHRRASVELEQPLSDGRWLRVFEKETSDGGRVGLRVDITHLKDQQSALAAASERAEAANRAKSAFLANMSHEIRTPMNGVVGMADLLTDTPMNEEQALYVNTIKNSGEALLVIINDVLDYSKIEADKLILHPEPFDLERTIHDIIMLLQPTACDKGLDMLVDYDMFLPTGFIGDPGRIRQVLTNLLGNAIKFTTEGHVAVRVVGIAVDGADTAIHINIEDTGIGIPEDKVDHVFGEFNQVEDERNRQFEGTGLGLAITKRLIALMGGEIWVDSELGRGSCFGFNIELPPVEPSDLTAPVLPVGLKTALVVEDHEANRSIISKQLAVLGIETRSCASGAAALAMLDPVPDLVLTDHNMPGMDGAMLARKLRELGHTMPILLLSSNSGVAENDPVRSDVQAVLQKPMQRRMLFSQLEKLSHSEPVAAPVAEIAVPIFHHHSVDKRRMRILAAEDNKTNRLVFSKMIKGFDVDLTFAQNGIEAVEAYIAERPDLIFMDISMPKMDGKEATSEIRKIEASTGVHVPIIALTAHAMDGDKKGILDAGLDEYLTKPLRKATIREAVTRHCPAEARDPKPPV